MLRNTHLLLSVGTRVAYKEFCLIGVQQVVKIRITYMCRLSGVRLTIKKLLCVHKIKSPYENYAVVREEESGVLQNLILHLPYACKYCARGKETSDYVKLSLSVKLFYVHITP